METLIFYQNLSYARGHSPLEPPKIKNNKNKLTENHKEALINQSFLMVIKYLPGGKPPGTAKKQRTIITNLNKINRNL